MTALTDLFREAADGQSVLEGTDAHKAKCQYDELMLMAPEYRGQYTEEFDAATWRVMGAVAAVNHGTPYAFWRDDPVGFVHDVLEEKTWSKQREVLEAIGTNKQVAVPSAYDTGKCLPYTEPVQLADGSVVTAGSLVGREFHMLGWRPDGEQIVRSARADWNEIEPVYRVTAGDGRVITRNAAHPLWAARLTRKSRRTQPNGAHTSGTTPEPLGWTATADLVADEMAVLVPDQVHTVGDGTIPAEHAALLGYLLGDGGTTADVRFAQMPGPALDEFMAIVDKIGARPVIIPARKGRKHTEVAVRGHDLTGNPALDLVKQWGIFGCSAKTKRVPSDVWRMAPSTIATVAGRLFSCDGYVHIRRQNDKYRHSRDVYLSLELVNEGLVRDFHRMMLRLGIRGNITVKHSRWQGKTVSVWAWTARRGPDIARFAELIDAPAKNGRIQLAATIAREKAWSHVWQTIDAPDGYHWERVQSVERLPDEQTVSIEVDEDHAWVDLFVEHNTYIAARATLWRSLVYPPGTSLTITTATRFRQVQRQLWPHIRQCVAKAGLPLKADTTQLKAVDSHGAEIVVAYGFSAPAHDEAAVQGIHAPRLFIVVDEAGGIARIIGQALRGLMTGEDTRMLAIGNPPTDDEGSWFESLCAKDDVKVVRISAYDAPALSGEATFRCRTCPPEMAPHGVGRHIVDRAWVRDAVRDYGTDSPFVIAKVHAKFPKGGSNRALPSTWVEAAADEPEPIDDLGMVMLDTLDLEGETEGWLVDPGAWVRLGVDVAADGGDEMVIARSVGTLCQLRHISSGAENANATDVAGKVLVEIKRAQALRAALGTPAPVRVKVDAIGVGWGVVGILKAWASEGIHDAEIVGVVVSEGTGRDDEHNTETFRPYRKRDEMWLATRSLLQPVKDPLGVIVGSQIRLRVDEQTKGQLSAPTYGTNSQGRTVIESKKSMRSRGLKSPDRAESLLLCVYEPFVPPVRRPRLIV